MIWCVGLLFSLLVAAGASPASHSRIRTREWPCPPAEEVAPCTCYADELLNIFLDCQDLGSISQLFEIFNTVTFPFQKFSRLQVSNSDFSTGTLDASVFGIGFVFREVIFYGTGVTDVSPDTFAQSAAELTFIEFIEPAANNFPLPADLKTMVNLQEAVMSVKCGGSSRGSKMSLPAWTSDTLVTLTVMCSEGPNTLPANAYSFSSLNALHLSNAKLEQIAAGNFEASTELLTVSLHSNSLEVIDDGVLTFTSELQLLDLSNNLLTDMPQITGMAFDSTVRISDNNIAAFSDTTTLPLIEGGVNIEAFNIVLTCGCEFQWLLGNDDATMPLNGITGATDTCGVDGTTSTYDEIRNILTSLC